MILDIIHVVEYVWKAAHVFHREGSPGAAHWRVLLTAAAYVLMQELRLRAAGTACVRAQVPWLRDRLLKLGVQVVRSVRFFAR